MSLLRRWRLWACGALVGGLGAAALAGDNSPPVPPVNCLISITVIRCSGKTPVAAGTLRACRRPEEIWRALQAGAGAKSLYHATREVCCEGQGSLDFVALENRPALFVGAGPSAAGHSYGLDLHLRLRNVAPPAAPPVFVLDWNGTWSDSPQLIAQWESVAVRGFKAASRIPGIMYQKTDEDEDGFVNTSHGVDVSGWFKKKPKSDATAPAADAAATESSPTGEPDYLADKTFETADLAGQCVAPSGGLIISRQPLGAPPNVDELYVLIGL